MKTLETPEGWPRDKEREVRQGWLRVQCCLEPELESPNILPGGFGELITSPQGQLEALNSVHTG